MIDLERMMNLSSRCTAGRWLRVPKYAGKVGKPYSAAIVPESGYFGEIKTSPYQQEITSLTIFGDDLPLCKAEAVANAEWIAMANPHDISEVISSHDCLISSLIELTRCLEKGVEVQGDLISKCNSTINDAKKLYKDGAWE